MEPYNHVIFDNESYPNIFTCCIGDPSGTNHYVYEISSRKNEFKLLLQALVALKNSGATMVGYNNVNYDYPCLHFLLKNATPETSNMDGAELAYAIFEKSDSIIKSPYGKYTAVWESEVLIPQLDLMKINHFDNVNRRTSLKCLEFKMRSPELQDLPFTPGEPVAEADMDSLVRYNIKDVVETTKFYHLCKDEIDFRVEISQQMNMNAMNFNDTKIGEQFFIRRLESELGDDVCYVKKGRKKTKKQTPREQIVLSEVLDPRIQFQHPEFNAIYQWINAQVISETKGVFTDLDMLDESSSSLVYYLPEIQELLKEIKLVKKSTKLISKRTELSTTVNGEPEVLYTYLNDGSKKRIDKIRSEYPPDELTSRVVKHVLPKLCVPFNNSTDLPDGEHIPSRLGDLLMVYGLGGIHASVHGKAIHSDDEWLIIDADVTGYYVNNIITIGAYPEHIGPHFTEIMKGISAERAQHVKGSTANAALKLAGNGVYGKTNDKHSPFYDPQCTMKITLNGQLFLTMLIDQLKTTMGQDVELIQANTDGITCLVRRKAGQMFADICQQWCKLTELQLEYAAYDHMYVKDVNNYLAVKQGGGIKAIGKYLNPVPSKENYKGDWAKNHSQLVVYKTAIAKLLDPELDVETAIRSNTDIFDFMFYLKGGGANFNRLEMHYTAEGLDEPHVIQKRSRFVVTTQGGRLYTVFNPTATNPDKERHTGQKAGRLVTLTNNINDEMVAQLWPLIDYDYYVSEVNKLLQFEEV